MARGQGRQQGRKGNDLAELLERLQQAAEGPKELTSGQSPRSFAASQRALERPPASLTHVGRLDLGRHATILGAVLFEASSRPQRLAATAGGSSLSSWPQTKRRC